jgi:two-component system response regulator AtoC
MSDGTTLRRSEHAPEPGGEFALCVVGQQSFETHPLPREGSVVLGRSEDCDVVIDDALVSRRHARIRTGATFAIEDLGSANGTVVGSVIAGAHQIFDLTPGQPVRLGSTLVIVQPSSERRAGDPRLPRAAEESALPLGLSPDVVVEDESMRRLFALAARVAATDISVLLLGETGAGKDVLASAIHRLSPRRERPLVSLNCGAFTETLLESELFGYERGAFTGATQAKPGLLESASGGTVFLDEVGDMPAALQVKLLRVIESQQLTRLGSVSPRRIDVRIVSATNRNLWEDSGAGRFRRDLYFRINGITLAIPPLRERPGEIVALAARFIALASARAGRSPAPTLSPAALARLAAYHWPGNIRELRNVLERALVLCDGPTILPAHVVLDDAGAIMAPEKTPAARPPAPPAPPASVRDELDGLERARILEALELEGGNQTRAARRLGIGRRTLISRLDAYGLTRPRKRRTAKIL